MLGTVGPVDTTKLTEEPFAMLVVPDVGFWLITSPKGTVVLVDIPTVPVVRPADESAADAALCVSPKMLGTVGPVDTTKLTEEPIAMLVVPDVGFWLITSPKGTVVLVAIPTVPVVRPADESADDAALCVSPKMLGTVGPVDTTRLTVEPVITVVLAPGFWLMTIPGAIVVEVCCVTGLPTTRPTPPIADVAALCVSPTTPGTITVVGADETTRFAVLVLLRKPFAPLYLAVIV